MRSALGVPDRFQRPTNFDEISQPPQLAQGRGRRRKAESLSAAAVSEQGWDGQQRPPGSSGGATAPLMVLVMPAGFAEEASIIPTGDKRPLPLLPRPYLRLPRDMPMLSLANLIRAETRLPANTTVELSCSGECLSPHSTAGQVFTGVWLPSNRYNPVMSIDYRSLPGDGWQ
mmetsp:Transcript_29763/g.83872  ORF Transcript_29763/g.83872 Transcript_29763/m.83872 type:complete len:172 (-) Transcript_29763:825-1340(-)